MISQIEGEDPKGILVRGTGDPKGSSKNDLSCQGGEIWENQDPKGSETRDPTNGDSRDISKKGERDPKLLETV